MKNLIKVIATFVAVNFSLILNAQCGNPYPVVNNSPCPVDFRWREIDAKCSPISTYQIKSVPAGGTVMLPLGGTTFEVEVEIIMANSCPITQINGPVIAGCGSSCTSPNTSTFLGGCC